MAVLAGSFVFIMHLASSASKEAFERQRPVFSDQQQLVVQYRKQFQTCLDEGFMQGIILVGHGGGILFNDTGEPYMIDFPIPRVKTMLRGNASYTAYQIYNPLSEDVIPNYGEIEQPPFYPCLAGDQPSSFYGADCYYNYTHDWSKFYRRWGSQALRYVHSGLRAHSDAKIFYPSMCSAAVSSAYTGINCPTYGNLSYSIQEQLQNYTIEYVQTCMNFSFYTAFGVNALHNASTANVMFSWDDTQIEMTYPVTLSQNGSLATTVKFYNYTSTVPARLLPMYALARDLIDADITNITFNLVSEGERISEEYYGGTFRVEQAPSSIKDKHIVRITDISQRNAVGGQPYYFQFIIENRNPALDYYTFRPLEYNDQKIDVYILEGSKLNFTPTAHDFDYDNITYTYEGWKATWDDAFSGPTCGDDPLADIEWTYGTPRGTNIWEDSEPYQDGCDFDGDFARYRCALSPTLACNDVGIHNITLTTIDPGGALDYQLIRILVDDKPFIRLWTNNTYGSIDHGSEEANPPISPGEPGYVNDYFASVEDPFLINATATIDVVVMGTLNYIIRDLQDPAFFYEGPDGILSTQPWDPKPDILNGITSAYPTNTGLHVIHVEVEDDANALNYAAQDFEIDVKECLPHNDPLRNAAQYPYHDFTHDDDFYPPPKDNDPYQSDHTCCTSGYTHAGSGTICYRLDATNKIVGCPSDFRDTARFPASLFPLPPAYVDKADLVYREFERKCSGGRGNICNGGFGANNLVEEVPGPTDPNDQRCWHCYFGQDPAEGLYNERAGEAWNPDTPSDSGGPGVYCNEVLKCTSFTEQAGSYNFYAPGSPTGAIPPPPGGTLYVCKAACSGASGGSFTTTQQSVCTYATDCTPCPGSCYHYASDSQNDYCP